MNETIAASQINLEGDSNMKQLNNSDFFYCYDYFMHKYLSDDGHRYIFHARSIKNGREFWLFQKSDILQQSIDEFMSKKNHARFGIG